MRLIRLVLAVLLATSLAVLPVSAAMAKPMAHASQAGMSKGTSGDKCPCCTPANRCAPDDCQLKCFSVPGISVEVAQLPRHVPPAFLIMGALELSPSLARPEPPPPRS